MKNYEAIEQWAATLNADKAYNELLKLKQKYPWLKCEDTLEFVNRMRIDLQKIGNMVKAQEKLNASYRRIIDLNHMADDAIISALAQQYHPDLKL